MNSKPIQYDFAAAFTFIGLWYVTGLIFTIALGLVLIYDKQLEEIRVEDIEKLLTVALFGPLVTVAFFIIVLLRFTQGIRSLYVDYRHKVLWRSKSSRAKVVLYGTKDNDDN